MSELSAYGTPPAAPPLAGVRVLEYAQYVAGPFATLLLADLGAEVIKVEPPGGDAWRRYEPFRDGHSRYFYALNRSKRSVVLDLKTEQGRRDSERLIATADAVVHNFSSSRASAYGLDRAHVAEINPRAVWCSVSAFGSDGPNAELKAFDLVAQAQSGLLLADVRVGDHVPRRAGGIAMADFTAGLLAAIAVLAGLVARAQTSARAPGLEVSLLGAALAVQAQRFVSVEQVDRAKREQRLAGSPVATAEDLVTQAARTSAHDELEPYYRAYRAADGFFVVACLNEQQRRSVLEATGCQDPYVENPQAPPATPAEREERVANAQRLERVFATRTVDEWVLSLRAAGIPAAEVRVLEQLFDDPQVDANGLLARLEVQGVGAVRQLGSLFKVDGQAPADFAPAPACGEHTAEILAQLPEEVRA
jgi:crotonobetainyl-CoA:carnitine CoA-transferase CaiB-like acyl-CoA transferase